MQRKEVMQLINDIEKHIPVHEWVVNGIHIWPFIRVNLAFRIDDSLNTWKKKLNTDIEDSKSSKKFIDLLDKIKHKAYKVTDLIKSWIQVKIYEIFFQLNKIDILFLNYSHYRTLFFNKWYSKFIDPITDYLIQNKIKFLTLEFSDYIEYQLQRHNNNKIINCNNYIAVKIQAKLLSYKKNSKYQIDKYEQFLELIDDCLDDSDRYYLKFENILEQINHLLVIKDLFQKILVQTQAKMAFVVNYYDIKGMALCAACYQINIPCIDLQHGIQGDIHIAYGNWLKVPQEGYNTLPSIFWNWTQGQANCINKWTKGSRHQSFVGGNLWNSFFNDNANYLNTYSNAEYQFLKKYDLNKIYILFTLQPMGEISLPDFFFSVYENSPKNWEWWFRLHPRQPMHDPIVKTLIEKYNISLSKIKEISKVPLNILLKHTDLHITQFSSVVLEAELFGVPSVCIHPNSIDMFREQINTGMAIYSHNNSQDLMQCILNQLNRQSKLEDKTIDYKEKIHYLLQKYQII